MPHPPSGYSPFNVQTLQVQGAIADRGIFCLARYEVSGNVITRRGPRRGEFQPNKAGVLRASATIAPGGKLNAPWGVAVAPASWGTLSSALLVANHGGGRISGFSLNGAFLHLRGQQQWQCLRG